MDLSKFSEYGRDYSIREASASSLPAGNASSVDCQQNYLSNNEIDMAQQFKPFDLEAAKAGASVMTRAGRPARILAFDLKAEECPIVVAIETHDGKDEVVKTYTKYGDAVDEYDDDLVMAPVKHRAWVNVYKREQYHIGDTFDTEEEAIKYGEKFSTYITTVLVEWEE